MRRSTRNRNSSASTTEDEATPSAKGTPPENDDSPKSNPFAFTSRSSVLNFAKGSTSTGKKKKPVARFSSSLLESPEQAPPPPPPPALQNIASISDLKNQASSSLGDLKRHLDRSHSEIHKDIEASKSRLYKRFKIQSQACQQVMDEAEKEHKKMSEQINESFEAMKDSYAEFLADAQATASRVCKTSISEFSQSFDKKLDALRSRFRIPSA